MALNARHRWCIQKIVETFDDVDEPKAQLFVRETPVLKGFNELFSAGGPSVLFVHYQSPEAGADDNWGQEQHSPVLAMSDGAAVYMCSKSAYFLSASSGRALDLSTPDDGLLLFGELGASPLGTIETMLSATYMPLLQDCLASGVGKADPKMVAEYESAVAHFVLNVQEALRSLAGGLELEEPDLRGYDRNDFARNFAQRASHSADVVPRFESLLSSWCRQVEDYLNAGPLHRPAAADGVEAPGVGDVGPRGELEYWRNRMQRLTSITEQLKRPDCRAVIAVLSTWAKNSADPARQKIAALLRQWKQIDVRITEAANEAKDNVKYLFTLERFIEPLYTGSPLSIIDALPALMNSIKMIHTIARYYNTDERMTSLFAKITEQMIENCSRAIASGGTGQQLWDKDPQDLVRQLEACLKLNEAYQEQYRLTRRRLQQNPKGKQFDFDAEQIFGKFNLFCRRVIKLIDMFSTIDQFRSLSQNRLEGMDDLIAHFDRIVRNFRGLGHKLLAYQSNKFDRDYVEFNVDISNLEGSLQQFINQSFENIGSIEHALKLLHKFQSILQRESLKSDLDSKLHVIFLNYGQELEQVQQLYERQKHDPPIPRNLPPVAGNITWSRHLLKRIEEPMKQFESNQNVLATKDAKRIIKMYNKVARTLVAFEFLWKQAWAQSIEQAKAGLQATLIIRHPDDGKLYVNFDEEILQLIREAKCLDRMGIEIPEAARIALFQEGKFKRHYNDLHWALTEYDRIVARVIPVTALVLRPHFNDMEYKLRPGMITLTWTSMNIDAYKTHVHRGLQKLEELVTSINDIIENRIEENLRIVSKTLLVDLPEHQSFSVDEFVRMQEVHIDEMSQLLQGKNVEVEHAVEDLVRIIRRYELDGHVGRVLDEEVRKLRKHYNHFQYTALLHCAKNSMNSLKKRIGSRVGTSFLFIQRPFFEVDVHLVPPRVLLYPSLDAIQQCINKSAQAILKCFKTVEDWGAAPPGHPKPTYFERITKDIEIVRVALLLTGCIQGVRNTVSDYLGSFSKFDWVWRDDKDAAYDRFLETSPTLDEYEARLKHFGDVELEISKIHSIHNIGALSLNTKNLKAQLRRESNAWQLTFCHNLHVKAKARLEDLTEYIRATTGKLAYDVNDLDTLGFMMSLLREVREKESGIDMEISPIESMYRLLDAYLPDGFMEQQEVDQKTVLRANWKRLIGKAGARAAFLSDAQLTFKRNLLRDVKEFKADTQAFRREFTENGPNAQGISPREANERLKRFKEELFLRQKKFQLYRCGEELFALPFTEYPVLEETARDVALYDTLFSLYVDVIDTLDEWREVSWEQAQLSIDEWNCTMEAYAARCRKMPKSLREKKGYVDLKKAIEDFQTVLPLLQELSKPSIKDRHWRAVMEITGSNFDTGRDFKLRTLLDLRMENFAEDIEEVADGADKQLKIHQIMVEIQNDWAARAFAFGQWKDRGVHIIKGHGAVMEELEEAQMNLQTMITQRHSVPFREELQELLSKLSETSDVLERWLKVQQMWTSLESVFTGGDIMRQMPMEAKKFSKVDKDWVKIMAKAFETRTVVECAANEALKSSLPVMYAELEKCQSSLKGYLEQKQNKFPRFYFVSDASLLVILSQGSDPLSMNDHYEKVFDAISRVEHDRSDKHTIRTIHGDGGAGHEVIDFSAPVRAQGNIEDWLVRLLHGMRKTMKSHCRACAARIGAGGVDTGSLRAFVDGSIAQFALLGIQIMWTADVQTALEQARQRKLAMKEMQRRQLDVLSELSSWCLQDLGPKVNRKKIETLVTIHVHQRDVSDYLASLFKARRISDASDFEWLKQARFYYRPNQGDDVDDDGAAVISITDVDFNYQFEYLGSKERLVITPLTDRCYITLAQALGMYFGGAPAGPAGTGKTETVKDLGRALGIYVVVTNCTDQMRYTDCAKIFKGLCQAGLWGCFDEFNRILLPVLSVVAQQVLSIQNAKKAGVDEFQFPGDPQSVVLQPVCGFFITMNPGYAGRQELPENLKALFRGVAMMVPDFQIIMKVKLCSVGYANFELLSQKFFVLYNTAKEQLSAQKHYDWGLRNILAVLRTAGKTKRDNPGDDLESFLLYRTLRDMNLSKLVAQDVPLFLSLLEDLFPELRSSPPPKGQYPELEEALRQVVEGNGLVYHRDWVSKLVQLYETTLVRHGIMLVGPSGGGKSQIFRNLRETLTKTVGVQHRDARLNPKAIRAQEMYGEVDPLSGEWVTGVFAAMWEKYNSRANAYNMWIICDGPVDAIWIEDLNTVLDDNKILTITNGDRIPMTDNVKLMFEVETLVNASPATVSRAGIIYVSETDLDWSPVMEAYIRGQPSQDMQRTLRGLVEKWLGASRPTGPGHTLGMLQRQTDEVVRVVRVGKIRSLCNLFTGLVSGEGAAAYGGPSFERNVERIFLYALCWSVAGLLEYEDRVKFDQHLREIDASAMPELLAEGDTIFEYLVEPATCAWRKVAPPGWQYPRGEKLDFSNLLVPTMDSTRANYIMRHMHKQGKATPVLIVGASGTAKTSTALMFFDSLDSAKMLVKKVNFSSATTPFMCQNAVEVELDKRGGKNFGPPGGKKMTFFIDDLSMPEKNAWGDQPTLEMVRLIVEYHGFCFLDKDKRGDFKTCEDLQYMAAMVHPGGGRNDIPNRLKRNFHLFNMVLPSITSINDIYGQMLAGRFPRSEFDAATLDVVGQLTRVTIRLWRRMKERMLPTPAKFHYVFNMRDLSRVFQGILFTPKETILSGGGKLAEEAASRYTPHGLVIALWKHECRRVFADKLTNDADKDAFTAWMDEFAVDAFGAESCDAAGGECNMVCFLRDDVYDEEDVLVAQAPKIYEVGGSLDQIRARCMSFLAKYNAEFPSKAMNLVLFTDALKHLLRINRLMEMPRGSGLLVGVGGSGKQSLTRLSAFISRAACFQVTLTKGYDKQSLLEDLKELYRSAGQQRRPTVFLFTESEIKEEVFLELMNSILLTGDVPGLFAKDEIMAITADLRDAFLAERPDVAETPEALRQFFIDCVRDNLHIMLCMSPMNPKFPERAQKFPGLTAVPTIDWFLQWPEEALVSVSQGFIGDFEVECTDEEKRGLVQHMGMVHRMVSDVCDEYFQKMRRAVHQTPKSYLSFIQNFRKAYATKLRELKEKESRVRLGLEKLRGGAEDVEALKLVLADEQVKLDEATVQTNAMLADLQKSSAEAKKESEQVAGIKSKCEADAAAIANEKAICEADLAKARPIVETAERAIDSIDSKDIGEIKKNQNPKDIIKLVFDAVMVLFMERMLPVRPARLEPRRGMEVAFIETSFKPMGVRMLSDSNFLNRVIEFGRTGKDRINEETVDILAPYIALECFTPEIAENASKAAKGLCIWARAMSDYYFASKMITPKLEALAVAEGRLADANAALREAELRLEGVNEKLAGLKETFDRQMKEKRNIEEGAALLHAKMNKASALINGLAGEQTRWTEDANNFADEKRRLVGDCAVTCAFVSYCGPFNQDFRSYLVNEKFIRDCQQRGVPVTQGIEVIDFLVDVGTAGDWNMEGLPTDPLSIQNGILVTRSERYPLLVDPQGQALSWIRRREAPNLPERFGITQLGHPKLKDQLEVSMGNGHSIIIVGVEHDIDPMLDPLLEREVTRKGKKLFITLADKKMDFDPRFRCFFITRLPNPTFSPELQAKTTVIDFAVTQKGLEEQLLGRVISKEQAALEERLNQVLEDVNTNTKSLLKLDDDLLKRLTSNSGDLLEDEELIGVLAVTKEKAADVKAKLSAAAETRANINEKREQFRPVATRGAVLYFAIVEMSNVNVMYQTSLMQFMEIFMASMDQAERAQLVNKRVQNIIETFTYLCYRYINRGLYEADKLTFVLLVTMKILVTAGLLQHEDMSLLLKGGASLDLKNVRRKPFLWISNDAWLNVNCLAQANRFFQGLPSEMAANEAMWKRWYEDNEPEQMPIPDYEVRLAENHETGPFLRLLLVRMLRLDRCQLSAREFVRRTPQMGGRFTEPVTDKIEDIWEGMVATVPVIFLLSTGADPTDAIESLLRKKKLPAADVISMGEGQEPVAKRAMANAAQNGTTVLLQNCELGIDLMAVMEEYLTALYENVHDQFRLFITALPSEEFPLGLLQMSTKVTNDPPTGLQAGLLRSYTVMVDQDRLERVETAEWRQLLFALCFLHSVVQERRNYGSLGWCIPYEYNSGDLSACILFLEKHLYNGPMSWTTFQYMVSEVQYGGKITDNLDRRLFKAYCNLWLTPATCEDGFRYNPASPIYRIPGDFVYSVPVSEQIEDFRRYCASFPEIDSPEIFGMHPNADLTRRNSDVQRLFTTLSETQPKGGGGGVGISREEVVFQKAADLLRRLPEDYVEDAYRASINGIGGLGAPLNIFLYQEIQRLQRVIGKVRLQLTQLQLAIRGEVVMTDALQAALDALSDGAPPEDWVFTVAGDAFSWILPTVGLWFAGLTERDHQTRTWLHEGRPVSYDMQHFFNPNGFLTAMKQEETRKRAKGANAWALDDVVYSCTVTATERVESLRSAPQAGVYVHGLSLEGGAWSRQNVCLQESQPKVLFVPLPVLHVSANVKSDEAKKIKATFDTAPYYAPCYAYASRTDRWYIFSVPLRCSPGTTASHWTLRSVALLTHRH